MKRKNLDSTHYKYDMYNPRPSKRFRSRPATRRPRTYTQMRTEHSIRPRTWAEYGTQVVGAASAGVGGFIAADAVSYLSNTSKNVIGIEIHSGRNRIVRRIFEHLGYDVRHLDRVMFANLTKKNVDRGKWRFLAEKEVRLLKFMNKSFTRKSAKEN